MPHLQPVVAMNDSRARPIASHTAPATEQHEHDPHAADILNSMSAQVAVLGPDGRIREVNRAWQRFAADNSPDGRAPSSTEVGVNYVALCRAATGAKADEAESAADGIEAVLRGERTEFMLEYPCDSPTQARWFAMHVSPLSTDDGGAVVAHYDISARKRAELALATQNQRTELALSAAHMGVWTFDLATAHIACSAEVYHIVGTTDIDASPEAWRQLVHPDDLPDMQARLAEAIERRMPLLGEFRIVRSSGETRWLSNVAHVECDVSGVPVSIVGTLQDITTRKRSEWALTAYNQILELIAAGADLHRILEEVVSLVEQQLPGSLCSVLILDKAAGRLRFGAGRSLPRDYNKAVDGVPVGPKSGSCGTAAFRRTSVTVTDIATDPLWEDYRAVAAEHGLRSCVSVPILSSGNVPGYAKGDVIGTFALYNRTPGDFTRLTYAILTSAQELVRRAVQADSASATDTDSMRLFEATHLAGVAIERDQAEHVIRESEERFRAVFDTAPAAIYIKDLDGRYLFVNRAAATMFGAAQADWMGRRARDILPPHLAELCAQCERTAEEAEQPVETRVNCRLADDRPSTVLATHMMLRHADGTPYAVCGLLRDITDQVSAREEFERLWLLAPEPLVVAGREGLIERVNPAWTQVLGWSQSELEGRPWSELVHPDDRDASLAAMANLGAGERLHRFVNRLQCADGSYRSLSWDVIVNVENGKAYGFARDVTDERALELQVRQAQKMEAIGRLASGVAHDFNNLLTVINGYSEMVHDEMPREHPWRESLTEVLDAGRRATELTSQLLAFSRKAIVEPQVLDVNLLITSAARMLRRLIGADVHLDTHLTEVPSVKIDPGQFEQVLMNLAVNARDAMPDGGHLSIVTERVELRRAMTSVSGDLDAGAYVRVSVSDSGCGMPPEVRARIFEPFYTTKAAGKGTGLGLATVYGIVRQAGGAITVESTPHVGTTFRILLPAVHEAPIDTIARADEDAPQGTETILLAEDETGVRGVASMMLERLGYTVLVAENGAQAARIAAAHDGPLDLLLTDVVMPELGGRALVDAVRHARPSLRVLYMSGYTDDAIIRAGIAASRDGFIQKPFTATALARRVRDVLDAAPPTPFSRTPT